uniref:FYVE, RhoGEF and PH domain-containing protein 1-like n=1 Tax=Pristiophorus japonicus TaxID=55135 RepID=UPI00398EF002
MISTNRNTAFVSFRQGGQASRSLVKSLSLDPGPCLEGQQAGARPEPTGYLDPDRSAPPGIAGERLSPARRSLGVKPQVPPKPSHLHRPRRPEPIPPPPSRPLPADPRSPPPPPQHPPPPAPNRDPGTPARVSSLIDKFER